MEHDLYIPKVYGVSAGACNAVSYAAKQPGRSAKINFQFCGDKRYSSYDNLFRVRSVFDMQFIFEEIPQKLIPFDYGTFFSSEIQTFIGATNLLTGKCDFFQKEDMDWRMFPVRASSAIPLASHIYYLNGIPYLDGGTSDPIPVRQSINGGNRRHIIVLTQDPTFRKAPASSLRLVRRVYRDYPNFVETVERRHLVYNRQRQICSRLERVGQAMVLQPRDPVKLRNIRADEASLRTLYGIGYNDAKEKFDRIRAFLEG